MTDNSVHALTSRDERVVYALQLLGDKTRYKLFRLLREHSDKCVGDVADQLGITISAVSQHFRQLELVGLVDKSRSGQKICYSLKTDDELVQQLLNIMQK